MCSDLHTGYCLQALRYSDLWWYGHVGRVSKAAIAPFRRRQYLDTPPGYHSHTTEGSIAFYEAFLDVKPCSEVRLAGDTPPPVIILSDAQVVPRERPGGGYLLADPLTGVRRGGLARIR